MLQEFVVILAASYAKWLRQQAAGAVSDDHLEELHVALERCSNPSSRVTLVVVKLTTQSPTASQAGCGLGAVLARVRGPDLGEPRSGSSALPDVRRLAHHPEADQRVAGEVERPAGARVAAEARANGRARGLPHCLITGILFMLTKNGCRTCVAASVGCSSSG